MMKRIKSSQVIVAIFSSYSFNYYKDSLTIDLHFFFILVPPQSQKNWNF